MKVDLLSLKGEKIKSIDLPKQFNEKYRPDVIERAVFVVRANKRQPYGAYPRAGKEYSAELSKRRRKYRGSYGYGISRVQRKIISRRGSHFNWVGAFIPGTVGGRRAHPPKAGKDFSQKINIKERRLAIRSAISSCLNKELIVENGYRFKKFPLFVESKIEELKKTKEVLDVLNNLGLEDELKKINVRKMRGGRGKSRGRRYKKAKGILIIVGKDSSLKKAAKSLNVGVETVKRLNAEVLAPNGKGGRLTIFSENAIEILKKEKLFLNNGKDKLSFNN